MPSCICFNVQSHCLRKFLLVSGKRNDENISFTTAHPSITSTEKIALPKSKTSKGDGEQITQCQNSHRLGTS